VPGFWYVTEWPSMMGIYEVGRRADGTPLEVPPHLVDAEHVFLDEDQPSSASN
jgi:hypothetical protein